MGNWFWRYFVEALKSSSIKVHVREGAFRPAARPRDGPCGKSRASAPRRDVLVAWQRRVAVVRQDLLSCPQLQLTKRHSDSRQILDHPTLNSTPALAFCLDWSPHCVKVPSCTAIDREVNAALWPPELRLLLADPHTRLPHVRGQLENSVQRCQTKHIRHPPRPRLSPPGHLFTTGPVTTVVNASSSANLATPYCVRTPRLHLHPHIYPAQTSSPSLDRLILRRRHGLSEQLIDDCIRLVSPSTPLL